MEGLANKGVQRPVAQVGLDFLAVHGAVGLPSRVTVPEGLKAGACPRHLSVWRGAVLGPEIVAPMFGGSARGEEG